MVIRREDPEPPADFAIDRETLAYIVLKARAFDTLVASDDPSDASNSADDELGINLISEHETGLGDPDLDTRGS